MAGLDMQKPKGLHCEAKQCRNPATHIYGPECEAETGKLMYLCAIHSTQIREWMSSHPNEPVTCPTHGHLGPVKSYVILKSI